jgi:hypothetical protein
VCERDGTFGTCVCTSASGGTTATHGSTTSTGGTTTSTGGTTTSTGGTTTSTGGTTTSTGGSTTSGTPMTCLDGHRVGEGYCQGSDVVTCTASGVVVSEHCQPLGLPCAEGPNGSNGDFADYETAVCDYQCPYSDVGYGESRGYCDNNVEYLCSYWQSVKIQDCSASSKKCVVSGNDASCQ